MAAMQPDEVISLYRELTRRRVPIFYGAGLCVQLSNVTFELLARTAEVHRNQIYAMLKETRPVLPEVRNAFLVLLGFDPWQEAGSAGKTRERNTSRRRAIRAQNP